MLQNILLTFTCVVFCLTAARCSNSKFVKTAPTITNSLVNLGKMEISFYLNGKHPDDSSKYIKSPSAPVTRSHSIEREPCPCNAKNSKESSTSFLSNPAEIINKILKNNDLFKDPTLHCCDSHEQIEENTVFFELNAPSRTPMTLNNMKKPSLPKFPFPFQKLLNQPSMFPMKPKAMEIFLFPKRKDMANMDFGKQITRLQTFFPKLMTVTAVPKPVSKAEILKVGDKEITPLNAEGASVKKDLTSIIEKKIDIDRETIDNGDDLKVEPPATTVNNAL